MRGRGRRRGARRIAARRPRRAARAQGRDGGLRPRRGRAAPRVRVVAPAAAPAQEEEAQEGAGPVAPRRRAEPAARRRRQVLGPALPLLLALRLRHPVGCRELVLGHAREDRPGHRGAVPADGRGGGRVLRLRRQRHRPRAALPPRHRHRHRCGEGREGAAQRAHLRRGRGLRGRRRFGTVEDAPGGRVLPEPAVGRPRLRRRLPARGDRRPGRRRVWITAAGGGVRAARGLLPAADAFGGGGGAPRAHRRGREPVPQR